MRFGVKEVANLTLYNLLTGKPDLFLDTLKMSNLENASETAYATGGQTASRLVGWDFNRTATFNCQDALLNPKAIAMQAGTELEKKKERIFRREVVTSVDSGDGDSVVSLEFAPVNGTVTVYESADGYSHDNEVAKGSIAISGKDLEIPNASLEVGKQVIVYYQFETVEDAEIITISSDKFGGYYMAVGDTLWRNEATGKDEKVQIVIPKAKIISSFTLTMQPDGEPSVFDFNLDVFKSPTSTDMVKLVRYSK